ncbi:MAG: single-stranded-DNA-specific exonuclease RecJ [Parcubacteria group bacterium]|nr:single-stranded-DNA-specific exonuclease RecJ [Parcubacteria group bacterium]
MQWKIAQKVPNEIKNNFPELNETVMQLLYNRHLTTQEEIDIFLGPDYSRDIHDPFLFRDMEKAVERVRQAISKKEKITVYADFDADGVTSGSILKLSLEKLGSSTVEVYLPDREKEGHGLRSEALQKIEQSGSHLVITCDCGTSDVEAIATGKAIGIDVIVTDHHSNPPELPDAYAILNPILTGETYPFKRLAGCGVAFKFAQALFKRCGEGVYNGQGPVNWEAFEKWLLDFVCIGTVADMMPLLDENRALVKYGLLVLNKTSRLGLRALIKKAEISPGEIDSHTIGFQIAPRINATSRINHASATLSLLLAKEPVEADFLADQICKANIKRQEIVEKIINEIGSGACDTSQQILFCVGKEWPIGVLGLISNRLMERYHKPVVTMSENKNFIKASVRTNHFDLPEVLAALKDYFVRFGGHKNAGGFELKQGIEINQFIDAFRAEAAKRMNAEAEEITLPIDAEVAQNDINWQLYDEVIKFEPFGMGNESPLFATRGRIEKFDYVGNGNKHLRFCLGGGKKFIYFGAPTELNLAIGDEVSVAFELGVNVWNGDKELQLKVKALKNG